jgi:hypothetical protein
MEDLMHIFADNYENYLLLGWHIFPLVQGSKVPHRGSGGLRDATADPLANEELALKFPTANMALRCGKESNVVVIDLDPRAGSDDSVRRHRESGRTFPDTVTSKTPRGGHHLYYAYDPRVAVSGANKLGRGIDVSTDGHYVVLPPSYWSEVSAGYRWISGPKGPHLPKLPAWAIEILKPKPEPIRPASQPIYLGNKTGYERQALADLKDVATKIASLADGRHDAPWRAAAHLGKYVHHGLLDENAFRSAIMDACVSNGALPKYSPRDMLSKIDRGLAESKNDPLPPLARIHREQGR